MSRLKPLAPFVLVAWTLLLWTGRLQLAWTVTDDSTSSKVVATVPVAIFVVLALVAAVTLWRRAPAAGEPLVNRSVVRAWRAVWVLVVWTIGYWFVRLPLILAGAHDLPFKAVHAVLAGLSWLAAGWAGSRTLWGSGVDSPGTGLVRPRTDVALDGHR